MYRKSILLLTCAFVLGTFAQVSEKKSARKRNYARDTIHVIGHAHMDMNWEWINEETMKMCNDNLRQAVAFMDEYPDYTMLQSEAAVFDFVEKEDSLLFEKVRKYVNEGRMEPVCGMWVESDQNLPSGEGLARAFLLGQNYLQNKFGRTAHVGWLPDDFGHTSQLPQMLKLAGCDYFYFMRCNPYKGPFWWIGPDSSRVLAYTCGSYNGDIKEDELKQKLDIYANGYNRMLQATGVGDHGGGPSRANIEEVHRLDKLKGFPAIRFTTAEDFFKKLENEAQNAPEHRGEMQFIFEGCYTTVSDNKDGNRNCENTLYGAEFLNSLCWLSGYSYPAEKLNDTWKDVVFNQFHDIITGSAIYESNRESAGRYANALSNAKGMRSSAFRKLVDEIDFQKDLGQPIVAFNMQPYGKKVLVEADVYSYELPITAKYNRWNDFYGSKYVTPVDVGQGNVATVYVCDSEGNTYPAQIIWGKPTPPGITSKIQFVVDKMPAGGYKTFYVDVNKPADYNDPIPFSNNTFETDYFTIRIDDVTGDIISLISKDSNKEFVQQGKSLNTLRMFLEDRKGQMKSWTINKNIKIEDVKEVVSTRGNNEKLYRIDNGPVRACIESVKKWGNSKFIIRTYIYKSYPRVDYDLEVHWLETGGEDRESPMLRAIFPVKLDNARFYCDVPFNVVERPGNGLIAGDSIPFAIGHHVDNPKTVEMNDGQEVPAQKWVDINDGENGFALLNKSRYGHSYHDNELRLTLMRSAGNPDIYPNIGKFNIQYSIYPHKGDWTEGVVLEGLDFNMPVYAAEPPSLSNKKSKGRVEEASLISLDKENVVISGIKRSEDTRALVVRLYEVKGMLTNVNLKLPGNIKYAKRLDLIERELPSVETPGLTKDGVNFTIRPHEIVTLSVSY